MLTPDERALTADTDAILQQQLRDIRLDGRSATAYHQVRVFLGSQDITDMVRTEVEDIHGAQAEDMRAELAAAGLI